MSCDDSSRRRARAAWAALAAVAALACVDAAARDLYKWTDKDGKVQYSDQPPKGFSGPVTRIEIDTNTNVRPLGVLPRELAETADDAAPQPPDILKKRRELRAQLEDRLRRARERLEAAKAALADGGTPKDDEHQVVQQRFANTQAGRSNCRQAKTADGKSYFICPALVPNDGYYERIGGLEMAVKQAEEAVDAAEQDYRRGVD